MIAHERGDTASAKAFADAALDASGVGDSGLGWGRGDIGIVSDLETRVHRQLQKFAGA